MNDRQHVAVVYVRYSSHKQGEQSVEGQLAAAYKYAAENGYRIIREYIDRAVSGKTDNREQFQQMLKDTAKRQFDTIILWKIDRFGRNREEIAFNKYRCKKNGVKTVYVAESIPDSPEGVILESVLEGMAEYYSLQLAQNVTRGLLASAKKGLSTGGTHPYGYEVDPKTKKFILDKAEAPIVKEIFKRYAEGATVSELIKDLNSRGLRTSKGAKFSCNSLYSVLRNEKYTGVYKYKDIRIEGGMPAIIDRETFERVQKMLKQNKRAPSRAWNRAEYILTDKLFCGKCGEKMTGDSGTGRHGNKYMYYNCINKKRKHTCTKKPVQKDWIEDIVLTQVLKILQNDEVIEFIADKVWEYYCSQNTDDETEQVLKQKLSEVEKATNNILKAIEAGIFNESTKNRMDELDAQREEIKDALAGLELTKSVKLTRDYIFFFLTELKKGDAQDVTFQKRLVDTFVNAVFVYDDKITIAFNYSGDNRQVTITDIADAAGDNVSDAVRNSPPNHDYTNNCPYSLFSYNPLMFKKPTCYKTKLTLCYGRATIKLCKKYK